MTIYPSIFERRLYDFLLLTIIWCWGRHIVLVRAQEQQSNFLASLLGTCTESSSCKYGDISSLRGVTICDVKRRLEICTMLPSIFRIVDPSRYKCGRCCFGQYNIDMTFKNLTSDAPGFFNVARDRWQKTIKCDPTRTMNNIPPYKSKCDTIPSTVDDLHICVAFEGSKDGPGGVLASGGPVYVDSISSLPVLGEMTFDVDDFPILKSKGIFGTVVLHEMAHVLGFGTLWSYQRTLRDNTQPPCQYAMQTKANAEWQKLTGCKSRVAIENTGGSGTFCVHWSEDCFREEVSSHERLLGALYKIGRLKIAVLYSVADDSVQATRSDKLSRITLASLEDLGYQVDYDSADPFSRSEVNPLCLCRRRLGRDSSSLLSSFPITPKLSAEGWTNAQQYGQQLLQENRENWMNQGGRPRSDPLTGLTYVGDLFVELAVEENGIVYFVSVAQNP